MSRIGGYDLDAGKPRDYRIVTKTVTMNGTSQAFEIPDKVAFTGKDTFSVVNGGADTTVALQLCPTGPRSFKITAASAVVSLKIKVVLTGY